MFRVCTLNSFQVQNFKYGESLKALYTKLVQEYLAYIFYWVAVLITSKSGSIILDFLSAELTFTFVKF